MNSLTRPPAPKEMKDTKPSTTQPTFQDPAILFMGAKPGENSLCSTASSEAGELWPTGTSSGDTLTQESGINIQTARKISNG